MNSAYCFVLPICIYRHIWPYNRFKMNLYILCLQQTFFSESLFVCTLIFFLFDFYRYRLRLCFLFLLSVLQKRKRRTESPFMPLFVFKKEMIQYFDKIFLGFGSGCFVSRLC